MSQRICYIIGAGDNAGTKFIKRECDYVIAVDGGYEIVKKLGIQPDLTVGDFDSLGYVPHEKNIEIYKIEKDDTDMVLAIKIALKKGFEKLVIYGGDGGRTDHTIGNIQAMIYAAKRGCDIEMISELRTYKVIYNDSLEIEGRNKGIFSVFALAGPAENVNITGGKYTMNNGTLTCDNPTAISNDFIGKKVRISVEDGILLVIYEN